MESRICPYRFLYITNLTFLDYLCRIVAKFRKSIIYRDFIPRLTRTITCFIDLRACEREGAAKEVYMYLNVLRNMRGFDALFPRVPYLSFELAWIGTGNYLRLEFLHDIPIHARFDRPLSTAFSDCPRGKTQINVHVTMKDPDPSGVIDISAWPHMLRKVCDTGFPTFPFLVFSRSFSFQMSVVDGVRHVRETSYYTANGKLDYDSRNINKRLWMASNKRHTLRCLTSLFYRPEHRRGDRIYSPLPPMVGLFRASIYETALSCTLQIKAIARKYCLKVQSSV
ncbi:hypothetical protein EDD85DRAFT_515921 [Armillaria nabsnona]|nr:hypothetical protein EDD85DRAFT_515921 [Armillaria nabsnona]